MARWREQSAKPQASQLPPPLDESDLVRASPGNKSPMVSTPTYTYSDMPVYYPMHLFSSEVPYGLDPYIHTPMPLYTPMHRVGRERLDPPQFGAGTDAASACTELFFLLLARAWLLLVLTQRVRVTAKEGGCPLPSASCPHVTPWKDRSALAPTSLRSTHYR